ncbi:MAG: hypothetical protein ACJAT4_002157 [Granulosicoccus sp.]|jgi:hypothetical protein
MKNLLPRGFSFSKQSLLLPLPRKSTHFNELIIYQPTFAYL